MAKVIEVDNYLLVRDPDDYILVFTFMGGIISRKVDFVIRNTEKIYFQCANEVTFVGNNHQSYYKCPNDLLEDMKQILYTRNLQILPWEKVK